MQYAEQALWCAAAVGLAGLVQRSDGVVGGCKRGVGLARIYIPCAYEELQREREGDGERERKRTVAVPFTVPWASGLAATAAPTLAASSSFAAATSS